MKTVVILLFCVIITSCTVPSVETEKSPAAPVSDSQRLIGTWDLLSWTAVDSDGDTVLPYGKSPIGMLIYTPEETAILSLSKVDRPFLGSDDYSQMSRDTILEAYSGFFSYHGTYAVDEKNRRVTHSVEACKIPDWRGRAQVRRYSFDDHLLVLRADTVIGLQHELRWKKRE